jgi:hypothetical protein
VNPLLRGAVSGVVATGAMSVVMLAFRREMGEQPPDAIVTDAAHAVGIDPTEEQEDVLASIAHAGFGVVSGAGYALLPRYGPPPLRGVVVALGIWATAYQGWLPALGILPPASRDKPARPATMIAAHVVFGAVLGECEDRLRRRYG